MGGKLSEKTGTDKERRQADTVSRGGLSQMGVGEMIGGQTLKGATEGDQERGFVSTKSP